MWILRPQAGSVTGAGFGKMDAMRAQYPRQSRIVRDQKNEAMLECDGSKRAGPFSTLFRVFGADNHQAGGRQAAGGFPRIGQARVIRHQYEHTCIESARRSC